MAETAAKRMREAKKREQEQIKAERKRLRKEGQLGNDMPSNGANHDFLDNRGLVMPS